MADELIPSSELTRERLKSILDAAYVQYSTDSDGDVVVRETAFKVLVMPSTERSTLTLLAMFGTVAGASSAQRLEYANKVNNNLIGIRAYAGDRDKFIFDYTVLTDAGISPRQILSAIRRFGRMLDNATDIARNVLS